MTEIENTYMQGEQPQEGLQDLMDVDEQEPALEENQLTIAEQIKSKSSRLPLSKIKKIAKMDSEYIITSNAAFMATAFATELFIQSFCEEAVVLGQLNKTGKKTNTAPTGSSRLGYNEMSECVRKKENFQFLEDVLLPITTSRIKDVTHKNRAKPIDAEKEKEAEVLEEEDGEQEEEVEMERGNAITADTVGNEKNDKISEESSKVQKSLSFFKYQANKPNKVVDAPPPSSNSTNKKSLIGRIEEDDLETSDLDEEEEAEDLMTQAVQGQLEEVEQLNHVVDIDKDDSNSEDDIEENPMINDEAVA